MFYTLKLVIQLPAVTRDITVTVSDGTNPIASANVTAGDVSGTTGDDGEVTLTGVSEKVKQITVTKAGYADKTESVTIDATHTSFTITLEPVDTITITVDDGEDTPSPIEGATVTIGSVTKTTDSSGECTFPDMTFQDYSAEISATGYITKTETIAFRSNHKSFTISLEAE